MAANKVFFKVGLQSGIDTMINSGTGYQVGTFYLTSDTDRLYVGQDTGLKLLNRSVQFAKNINELNTLADTWTAGGGKTAHKAELAYVTDSNILCFWDGSNWTQINPDTYFNLDKGTYTTSTESENNAKVNLKLDMVGTNDKMKAYSKEMAFNVAGENIGVAGDGTTVKLTGDVYNLSSTGVNGSDFNVDLKSTFGKNSTVKFKAGNNVKFTNVIDDDGKVAGVTIDATDIYASSNSLTVNDDGSLTSLIQRNGTTALSSTSAKIGYILDGEFQPVGTPDNPKTLPVYTKAEIDATLKGLNGLKYCGTIGAGGDHQITGTDFSTVTNKSGDTVKIENGNMFLVAEDSNGDGATYATGKKAKQGDLLIACGTEGLDGYLTKIDWTYVPSGDDVSIDTTYTFTVDKDTHKLTINSSTKTDGPVCSLQLKAGTAINIESELTADGTGLISTIKHADVAHTTDSAPAEDGIVTVAKNQFKTITGVTVNAQGHVTAVQDTTFKPVTYKAGGITLGENNAIIPSIRQFNGDGTLANQDDYAAGAIKLTSDTLQITMDNTAHTINSELVWGTF